MRKKPATILTIWIFLIGAVWFLISFYYPEVWIPVSPGLDLDSEGIPIVTGVATLVILGTVFIAPLFVWTIACRGLYVVFTGEKF